MIDLADFFAAFGDISSAFVFAMHKVIALLPKFKESGPELQDDRCRSGLAS
jgi:hypothetical protein